MRGRIYLITLTFILGVFLIGTFSSQALALGYCECDADDQCAVGDICAGSCIENGGSGYTGICVTPACTADGDSCGADSECCEY